ncbi:GM25557 [Drosophila sechellia]|uniref:GM25557 n=1 Tax=Drosophila sechellia TaxID=7238 RepID=B4HIJ5_DROSE|nr:GM25557 [Drosophila sechellia]
MYVSDEHRYYRKARRKFSLKAYGLLVLWLILALAQWLVIAFIEDAREIFTSLYYICLATFALAILIFGLFIFFEKLRFINGLNFIMSLIIVELQIISTFALVAISWWADVLTFFGVALILMAIFLLIGVFLPADLTLDIAVLFILAFLFLNVASFILLFELLVSITIPYAYLVVEMSITFTILLMEQSCHRGSPEDLMTLMIVIQMQKNILRFQAVEEIQGIGTPMTQITFTDTGQIIGIPQKIGQFTIKGQRMDLGVVEGPELKVRKGKPYTTDIVSRTNGILNI